MLTRQKRDLAGKLSMGDGIGRYQKMMVSVPQAQRMPLLSQTPLHMATSGLHGGTEDLKGGQRGVGGA